MRTARQMLGLAIVLGMTLGGMPADPARAQVVAVLPEEIADEVAASTVMLTALVTKTEDGVAALYRNCFLGSGSIVSADARLILTNSHVVDLVELAESFASSEAAELTAASPGRELAIQVSEIAVWVVDHTGMRPDQRYRAEVIRDERALDLALLRITGDSQGRDHSRALFRPHLQLGDSAGVRTVHLFGYPATAPGAADDPECVPVPDTRTIQQLPGPVTGFSGENLDLLVVQAGASPGMSGGAAVDDAGRLIGVPAQIQMLAAGGGAVEVIPIERAEDLLREFVSVDEPTPEPADTPPPPSPTPAPSPAPTPTSTPLPPPTPSPTPTPTPHPGAAPLPSLLPGVLPLPHALCFRLEESGEFTIDELASRFTRSAEAGELLRGWGMQGSVYRAFACDGPSPGAAGYVYIGLHQFATPAAARQATDYFAAELVADTGLPYTTPPVIGDYAVALAGPAWNGDEFTLYTSSGSLLIRVTGVSPAGGPSADVEAIARAILDAAQTGSAPSGLDPELPASAVLPAFPAVTHVACFRTDSQGAFTADDLANALLKTGMSMAEIEDVGWQNGAYVVFLCDDPPPGRATQIDVVAHQFADQAAASYALPYVAETYTPGENEARSCETLDTLVVCVTGIALSGSPLSDVAFVLQQVLATAQ